MTGGAIGLFERLAQARPDAPFLSIEDRKLSRAEFLDRVRRVASYLAGRGIGPGDTVAIQLPNSLAWCSLFWGTVALGAVPAPLDPQTGRWEIARLASILPVRAVFAVESFRAVRPFDLWRGILPGIPSAAIDPASDLPGEIAGSGPSEAPVRDVTDSDTLLFALTSGTTGNPKILRVPHLGFLKAQRDMSRWLGWTESEKVLLGMPLFHQGGFGMGLQALCAGGEALYRAVFDPGRFLSCVASERATAIQLSPTLAKLLLSSVEIADVDLSSLRMAYFAGEALPEEVAAAFWRDRGIRTINVVGSSETATMVAWDSSTDSGTPPGRLRPLPFTRVRVLSPGGGPSPFGETGRLLVSTDGLLTRYEGNPDETSRKLSTFDGSRWFDTGDLASPRPDGTVVYVGRSKRIVKRGPNLVHPEELESFLLEHPDIAAVVVTGEPHGLFGESLLARVQPRPGAHLDAQALRAHCHGRIAAYKIPDRFLVVESLPADIGKIQHRNLTPTEPAP